MTCIVGIVEDNEIFMGCDTITSPGDGNIRNISESKIIKKNNCLIGVAGSALGMQILLNYDWSFPKNEINKLPFILRNIFKENEYMDRVENGIEISPCLFMVGYQNQLYEIDSDFCMISFKENYHSIGSGEKYALGSLFSTKNLKLNAAIRIELAIRCADNFRGDVGGEYNLFNLK